MEGGGNNINNNNNTNNNSSCMMMENGLYPMLMIPPLSHHQLNHSNIHHNNNNNKHQHQLCGGAGGGCGGGCGGGGGGGGCYDLMDVENQTHNHNTNESNNSFGSIKAKIVAHPHYPRLLSAYVNCQKVGAPPEVVAKLEEAEAMAVDHGGGRGGGMVAAGYIGEDPALDQFMEAYCEMLTKYEQELTKPFKEAMLFLSRIECQFKALTLSSSSDSRSSACGEGGDHRNNGSSEEDIDIVNNNGNFIDPSAEDRELKGQLLRKYSGYLGSLRQEFLKKRKKGKLPKEARQQLLDWWSRHYKWPYPSESQKLALAESTGLDQKQINNWFINQRKRHWKPSEDMQFVVMDAAAHHAHAHAHAHTHAHPHPHPHAHAHAHAHYGYMDNVLGNPFSMGVSPTLM